MQLHSKKNVQLLSILLLVFFVVNIYLSWKCFEHNKHLTEAALLQVTASAVLYLVAAITFIQYCFFKENTYLFYVLYILVNVLYFTTMASFEGGNNLFEPYWFHIARFYLPIILLILSYYLYTWFAINFLSLKTKDSISYNWLKRFTNIYLIFTAITLLLFFFPLTNTFTKTIRAIVLIACMPIGLISIVIVFVRVKNNITRILCIGSGFFLVGSILGFVYAGKTIPFIADVFPLNRWLFYTEAGTILETIMFSSSFAYRNKIIADEEKVANQKLLHIRDEIARDLHDDIGASLSNINILNELARRNAGNDKAGEYLNKASEDIQHVSESLSDIVWSINPHYDDINNLLHRMRRYAADITEGKNIDCEIDFPQSLSHIGLDMDKRRNLFLIFKEAINNMIKYSGATKALVQLLPQSNTLLLLIKDNGTGFDASRIDNGNGLRNMKQRAEQCQAHINIVSKHNQGTIVELIMPIKNYTNG